MERMFLDTVTAAYKFTAPGIYKLQLNVTDQKGVTNTANTNGNLGNNCCGLRPTGGRVQQGKEHRQLKMIKLKN